jgi:eukaryotic-like serine/threonine-protein kinase
VRPIGTPLGPRMTTPKPTGDIARFGVFEPDLASGDLRKAGRRIPLQNQAFELLKALLERPGALVTRDELRRRLWADDTFVDFEHGVNAAVKRLRDALGDSAALPRFVETVPRKGYRFVAPVSTNGRALVVEGPVEPSSSPRRLAIAGATVLLVGVVAVGVAFRKREPPRQAAPRGGSMVRLTDDTGLTMQPTLSADGRLLAYASDRAGDGNLDIWIQSMTTGEPMRLTSHPADDDQPSLSPDGTQVVFRSRREGGGIYVMPANRDGEARRLTRGGLRPRFSPDGRWIAYNVGMDSMVRGGAPGTDDSQVFVVPAAGGESRRIAPEFFHAHGAVWSKDGRHLLFFGIRSEGEEGDWWVIPAEGGTATKTGLIEALDDNELEGCIVDAWPELDRVLLAGRVTETWNIWAWPLSPGSWQARDGGQPLTTGASLFLYSAAREGVLVASALQVGVDVWSLPVIADEGRASGPLERLTRTASVKSNPSVSADGRHVSYATDRPDGKAVWSKSLDGGGEHVVAEAIRYPPYPLISRDGSRIAYRRWMAAQPVMEAVGSNGEPAERICGGCRVPVPQSWSSDGRWLVHMDADSARYQIAALNLTSGESVVVLRHESHSLFHGDLSSDSRWIVFMEGGPRNRNRLWAAPFRGRLVPSSEWVALTDGESADDKPRWSPNGELVYFVSDRDGFGCIWAQRVHPDSKQPIGPPFVVYHSHTARLSILNVPMTRQEMSVARDRIVLNLGEATGNIWSLPLPRREATD